MESKQIDRRQFLTALLGGSVAGMFVMGSGSTGPAGSNANVGPGTANKLAKFLSANTIGDSAISDDGSTITTAETIQPSTDNLLDLGTSSLRFRSLEYSTFVERFQNAGDANPTVRLGTNILYFGPGGASALDVSIRRIASGRIGLYDASSVESLEFRADSNIPNIRFMPAGTSKAQINHDGSNFSVRATSGSLFLGDANIIPVNDNVQNYGTNSARWLSFVVSSNIARYASAGDANPTFKVSAAQLEFGAGGATALDVYLKRISAGLWETQAMRPQTDATYDFGTSSLRNRDIYASRRVIIAGKNALVLDGQSMTQSSHTVSNADTDITTYSLGANSYTRVIVRVTGYVSFVTLSTNQSVNLKIKDGTTQVGNTMVVDGALSATASIPFTIEAAFVETSAVTIHFTEGAAAADANTTVFINSIIVLAES